MAMICNALSTSRPRTFLITGTTDGIGKHTSQKLASDGGHALLIHGRKSPSDSIVKSLIQDLKSRGASQVAYLQADLSDLDQVESLAERAIEQLQSWQSSSESPPPSLDVLLNNAGVFDPEPRRSVQGYDATMAINVLAPYVLTRKLLPSLVRGEGVRIITTSSISQSRTLPDVDALFARKLENGEYKDGIQPLPYSGHSFYSYSKLGDLLFTVQLAKLLSKYHPNSENEYSQDLLDKMQSIQCLTMDPGTVNTKMLLAGWGPCGIPVEKANNTYKLASGAEYAFGESAKSGSYHFGGGASNDSKDEMKLNMFWNKLAECTGVNYDDLSDCLSEDWGR